MFVRLLIYFAIGVLIYRFAKRWMGSGSRRQMTGHTPEQVDDVMIKDPVCGAYFPKRKGVTLTQRGKLLYFCSEGCRNQYQEQESGRH